VAIQTELALDDDGDLAIEGGGLTIRSGASAVSQRIKTRLQTIRGEWVFDASLGTPWFQQILGGRARARLGLIQQVLRERIADSQGVDRVVSLETNFDAATRGLTVTGSVVAEGGSTVPVGLEFAG
jgi:hypothetical protein